MSIESGDSPVGFWKRWIQLQTEHNLENMVKLSIKNFHFPGLNYVCFEFSPEQTIRLYIIEPSDQLDTQEVQIHNHLYDSQILALQGTIVNRVYRLDNTRDDYRLFRLTSALHPDNKERKIKLELIGRRGLTQEREIRLTPGRSHFQKHTEIHNVENDRNELTAFMVFEFRTVKERSTLFTRRDLGDTIDTPGCYLRYEPEELKALVHRLLDGMDER